MNSPAFQLNSFESMGSPLPYSSRVTPPAGPLKMIRTDWAKRAGSRGRDQNSVPAPAENRSTS